MPVPGSEGKGYLLFILKAGPSFRPFKMGLPLATYTVMSQGCGFPTWPLVGKTLIKSNKIIIRPLAEHLTKISKAPFGGGGDGASKGPTGREMTRRLGPSPAPDLPVLPGAHAFYTSGLHRTELRHKY